MTFVYISLLLILKINYIISSSNILLIFIWEIELKTEALKYRVSLERTKTASVIFHNPLT